MWESAQWWFLEVLSGSERSSYPNVDANGNLDVWADFAKGVVAAPTADIASKIDYAPEIPSSDRRLANPAGILVVSANVQSLRGPFPGVNKPKASGGAKGSKGAKAAKGRGKGKRCKITVAAAAAAADAAAAAAQISTGQLRPESFLSADVLAKYRKSQTGKRDLVVDQLLQRKPHLTGMQETRQFHNGPRSLGMEFSCQQPRTSKAAMVVHYLCT